MTVEGVQESLFEIEGPDEDLALGLMWVGIKMNFHDDIGRLIISPMAEEHTASSVNGRQNSHPRRLLPTPRTPQTPRNRAKRYVAA